MTFVATEAEFLSGKLRTEQETQALAKAVGDAVAGVSERASSLLIALEGELGAGKSFFARALLASQGVTGPVRSPTYTLIEPYECRLGRVLHLDLYRLADPEEMLYLGLEDQLQEAALALIEWPSKGQGYLPAFDITLKLCVEADFRTWRLSVQTIEGQAVLAQLRWALQNT